MLKFSDGMTFDTSGPMRAEHRSDGWYVVGGGMLIPADSRERADEMIKAREERTKKREREKQTARPTTFAGCVDNGFVWCFSSESVARACVELMVRGNNVGDEEFRDWLVKRDEDGWILLVAEKNEAAMQWMRGFACAFARLTPGESDLS